MLKEERQKMIIKEINLHNKVLSTDLSLLLKVSDDTIRRDLKELVDSGKILKVHGGAVSPSFVSTFTTQTDVYAAEEKKRIVQKALKLIKNNSVIVTEGGTTMLELARMIPDHIKATFFTISPQVAITLSEHSNLDVVTIGGKLVKNANLHIGSAVINRLAELRADICFLGANAFSVKDGLTDVDWEVVQVKKALIRCAKKVVVMTISEKLDTVQRLNICGIDKVDYLITELPVNSDILKPYQNTNLVLL
ncbi:DeoR/GlpR family DNA-binding transcription regulator [Mucilaginibacter boryungensis]|uniref:DeoR/GlpR transcriptional regulator n=1 Tax=Mucilaginibacter boryungensis TaxID=768480 RepID=A0ABR9XJN1_9SPHI|nr:DeoR/GlpR family DNA-binding transcription regulator [Mucilaginibacter boryungensis]MBE9667602.1 DeoR/GlpR transcriptional regulator [Mucilaginibacter boryungensis]